jgi:predicted amidohydrolase YtcJ
MVRFDSPACLALIFAFAACSTTDDPAEYAETVYTNGKIYTLDQARPWAESFAIKDGEFLVIGSNAEVQEVVGADTEAIDLNGRFVMPGIVDSHTHPGLMSFWGEEGADQDSQRYLPTTSKEDLFEWLRDYAAKNPNDEFVNLSYWDVAMFLPEGPHRSDLDAIFPDRPVMLFDNSGHSTWLNSAALAMFGVDRNTTDLSQGISYFVRDRDGAPTGWAKEFVLFPLMGDALLLPKPIMKERLAKALRFLSGRGVTTLWDAGNYGFEDRVYEIVAELDRAGALPIRYEASYHIYAPNQIDVAVDELLRLRGRFGGDRLKFNTVKIHYDGVSEIATAAMLEDFVGDPGNRGGVLFEADRLSEFMLELDDKDVNLHLHAVGDWGTREILDALEIANTRNGGPLGIQITICHLETVDPVDIPRFRELRVHANFTPHWFGGTFFGGAGAMNLGPERAYRSQVVGEFVRSGANVTLSSDTLAIDELYRADPFIGMQMSVTRQEFDAGSDSPVLDPPDSRISLEEAIAAYTRNGARQLGLEGQIGSIETGKRADFLVLDGDPFQTKAHEIYKLKPALVAVDGELVGAAR